MQLARHYQSTRQPGSMSADGMEGQRLVFLYPIAVDTTLGKYANLCRDFFTVSFINEIKIDNVLGMISSVNQSVGTIGTGNDRINPAELIYRVAHKTRIYGSQVQPTQSEIPDSYYYNERVKRINEFLKMQLQHDPRYSSYRAVFSTIAANDMLDIPLIIGTKAYQINNEYLYLLMMISIIYGITWRDETDINRAHSILRDLVKSDPGSIIKLIVSDENRHKFELEAKLKTTSDKALLNNSDYNTKAGSRIAMYLNNNNSMNEILFGLMFNRSKWTANFPESTKSSANLTFNSLNINTTRTQKRHYEKSLNALTSYISEYIIPVLHSLDIFAGPSDPTINVPDKISAFIDELINNLSDTFVNLSNNINQGLININAENLMNDMIKTSDNIQNMCKLCEDNVNLGQQVDKIFTEFSSKSRIKIDFTMTDLMSFVNDMSTIGSQCSSMGSSVDSWLKFLSQQGASQLINTLRTMQSQVDSSLKALLYQEYPTGSGHGAWVSLNILINQFVQRFANYSSVAGLLTRPPPSLSVVHNHAQFFKQYLATIESSIREMLIFLIKWIFFSYSCDYLNDVEVDVEIQKRDALEFPNFCLVLPLRLFKDLYFAQINKNFKNYLTQDNVSIDTFQNRELSHNFNDIKGVFQIVTQQLKIPNLIVIDEKMKKCHYQFMYMTRPASVNFATMEGFIAHQKDVLPGF